MTDQELAYIISVLAKYWNDREVRGVMRLIATKKTGKEKTQPLHE